MTHAKIVHTTNEDTGFKPASSQEIAAYILAEHPQTMPAFQLLTLAFLGRAMQIGLFRSFGDDIEDL